MRFPLTSGSGLATRFTRATSPGVIAASIGIIGLGVGFTFQPTQVALQAHCTLSKRAVAVANRDFFRSLGGACGLAISSAVLQAVLKANLPAGYAYLAHTTYALPDQSAVPAADWEGLLDAYMAASHAVFLLQFPLIGTCLLGCLLIQDRGLERPREPEEEGSREAQVDERGLPVVTTIDVESGAPADGGHSHEQTSVHDIEKEAIVVSNYPIPSPELR
jgi:hypothetical protein